MSERWDQAAEAVKAAIDMPYRAGHPARLRRLLLGQALIRARALFPASGRRAGGWSRFIAEQRLNMDVALDAMKYARFVDGRPAPDRAPEPSPDHTSAATAREQRVYFIQGFNGGPIKIGVSLDPDERLSTLQTASPIRLRIIGMVRGGPTLERALHQRLAAHRLHGEWFTDAPEVLTAITESLQ